MICQAQDRGYHCTQEAIVVVKFNPGYFTPEDPEIEPECEFHFRAMQNEVDSVAMRESNEHCYRVVRFFI